MGGNNVSVDRSNNFASYIKEVCSFIKFKEAHKEISLELSTHLEEIYDESIEKGLPEEDALNNAVNRMGTPFEVGKQLNLAHKGTPDWITLVLTLVLVNIGVILMYFIKGNNLAHDSDYIFSKSLIYAFIGTILIIVLYFFDYRKIEKYSKYIFVGTLIITSVLTNITHSSHIANVRLITVIIPYILIISLAGIFNSLDWNEKINLVKAFALLIIPVVLMIENSSTSSALIYCIGFLVLSISSKIKISYVILITAASGLPFAILMLMKPYRLMRLLSFINPSSDPLGNSYVNNQINNIVNSAGLLGKGFSFPNNPLPEVHTEFILSYILYSLGWIGIILLITLIAAFIIRVISITKLVNHTYGKLLIEGIVTIISVQFILNILMNFNLMPLIGMSMPFISYSSTLGILNMMSVGLILSVHRRRSLTPNYNKTTKKA